MPLLIGTDEAGYGPNLGPLVISATAWYVPAACSDVDLYDLLQDCVSRVPLEYRATIADSKSVYSPSAGLRGLEQTIFSTLAAAGQEITSWRQIWPTLIANLDPTLFELPWHCTYDEPLPSEVAADWLAEAAVRFCNGLLQANVQLWPVHVEAIFPAEFNRLVEHYGSKGTVLSRRTLELVDRVLRAYDDRLDEDSLTVVHCDKHGGRNHYQVLLQTIFPEYLVEVVQESRACSIYRLGPPSRRVEFRFTTNGERFLPTALASMYAKYVREQAMRAFNAFWTSHQPGLKPTAGYPNDSQRFRSEIATKLGELAIDSNLLWRCR